jgi:hypothetical protein
VARYGRPLATVNARVAGHDGREYSWSPLGRRLVAYVLPTAAGDGAIVCQAPTSAAAAVRSCAGLAARARASGDQILAPGPDRLLARAIGGPVQDVMAARARIGRLRGPLPARRRTAAAVAHVEEHAAALLAKLVSVPRYRGAIARLTRALSDEATALAALAEAARATNRTAYVRGIGHVTAASRALQAASHRLGGDQLGVPGFAVLHLAGPPAAPQPSRVVVPSPASPSTTSGASSGSSPSPAPPAGGGTGTGTSTTYVTPFS